MKKRGKPKKPESRISVIALGANGTVRKEWEELPRDQKQLELTIGNKFAGALRFFLGIQLTGPEAIESQADLSFVDEKGEKVLLASPEVV
jgi:hypothetical protein